MIIYPRNSLFLIPKVSCHHCEEYHHFHQFIILIDFGREKIQIVVGLINLFGLWAPGCSPILRLYGIYALVNIEFINVDFGCLSNDFVSACDDARH